MGLREDIEITRKVASDLPFGQDEETVMRVCDAAEKWEAIRESLPIVLDAAEKWAAHTEAEEKKSKRPRSVIGECPFCRKFDCADNCSGAIAYRASQEESK